MDVAGGPVIHSHSPIVIRPAALADAEAIDALELASFAHAGERLSPRRVRSLIVRPRSRVLVAEENGTILGWVAGFVWPRGKTPWGRVYAIAVDSRARGRQLGRRLMERIIAELQHRAATQIFLEVRTDNHAALKLYEKLGFTSCRSLPDFYGAGLAAMRMVRLMPDSHGDVRC